MPLYPKPSAGGTPGGSTTQVQFNNAGVFGGDAGFTYGGNGQVSLALGTITANNKAINITGTWNNAAITYDAPLFMNITNTASATGSMLVDLQLGGSSFFNIRKDGFISAAQWGGTVAAGFMGVAGATGSFPVGTNTLAFWDATNASGQPTNIAFGQNVLFCAPFSAFNFALQGKFSADATHPFFDFGASLNFRFFNAADINGAGADVGFTRSAAGVLEINSGAQVAQGGTLRDTLVRAGRHSAVTFANAVATPPEGTIQAFTDSTTNVWGVTITGGGANHVLGYFNGTNWTVMAK